MKARSTEQTMSGLKSWFKTNTLFVILGKDKTLPAFKQQFEIQCSKFILDKVAHLEC